MGLRDVYNRLEQVATPLANELTRSPEFARAVALVSGLNKTVRDEVDKVTARAWHVINLPAGTDVQRLKVQLGAMDREIRLLTLELERARAERMRAERARATSSPTQSSQTRSTPAESSPAASPPATKTPAKKTPPKRSSAAKAPTKQTRGRSSSAKE